MDKFTWSILDKTIKITTKLFFNFGIHIYFFYMLTLTPMFINTLNYLFPNCKIKKSPTVIFVDKWVISLIKLVLEHLKFNIPVKFKEY